eukprot:comp6922_c0_seq2/m.2670 comp6922_c0_seq2/g.2670  ORF comp6922_c0_seq2/g.2670 comp6922_c0_seq2/m.2670 type:complete len:146 (-) comp6922_c0_seq2:311-748(-)
MQLGNTFIIESQPWRCYRNAEKRLRRLGQPGHSLLDDEEPEPGSRAAKKLQRDQERRKKHKADALKNEAQSNMNTCAEGNSSGDGDHKDGVDKQDSVKEQRKCLAWRQNVEDEIERFMCEQLGYKRNTFGVTAWDRTVALFQKND